MVPCYQPFDTVQSKWQRHVSSLSVNFVTEYTAVQVRGLRLAGDFFFSNMQVKVWEGEVEDLATVFLEPNNGNFWVGCIYGRADDARRFGFFCGAALEYLRHHSATRCLHVALLHCISRLVLAD